MKIKLGLIILITFALVLSTCSAWEGDEGIVNIRLVGQNGGSSGSRTLIGMGDADYGYPADTPNPFFVNDWSEKLEKYNEDFAEWEQAEERYRIASWDWVTLRNAWDNYNANPSSSPQPSSQLGDEPKRNDSEFMPTTAPTNPYFSEKETTPLLKDLFADYQDEAIKEIKSNPAKYSNYPPPLTFAQFLEEIKDYEFDIYFAKKLYPLYYDGTTNDRGDPIPVANPNVPKNNIGASRGDMKIGKTTTLSLVPGTWNVIVRAMKDRNIGIEVLGVARDVEIKPGKNEDILVEIGRPTGNTGSNPYVSFSPEW